MNKTSRTRAVIFALCAASTLATSAMAQTYDKRMTYTFNNQVELPGMTLPAGQYMFRLADPDSGRQVLRVSSTDGKKVYGTFFSMPLEAAKAPNTPQVRFMESAPGAPMPIKAVWYTGERTGREFIYPRRQAIKLAKTAKEPVLTTAAESATPDETKGGSLSRVSASGDDQAADAAAASPAPAAMADVQGGGSVNPPREAPRAMRTSLPKTATNRPLAGLTGLLLLGFAGASRLRRVAAADRAAS